VNRRRPVPRVSDLALLLIDRAAQLRDLQSGAGHYTIYFITWRGEKTRKGGPAQADRPALINRSIWPSWSAHR